MDENILIENLDKEALSKILLHQIDLLSIGEGDMDLIKRISKALDKKESSKSDYLSDEKILSIIERTKQKYVTIIEDNKKDKSY